MTAKEKAKELVLKYLRLQEKECDWIHKGIAKQSSLIAVDLAIEYNDFHIEFLQEVKQEIEKL
jgi:hypothetical protein